jgi:hypothetical protein
MIRNTEFKKRSDTMRISTGTLTINPAFLQDIKDDNIHLKELLAATSTAFSVKASSMIRPRALTDLMSRLRDQLATHFSLEEFFGYFDDAIDAAPRLSAEADLLRCQHEDLYLSITELAEDAERLLYGPVPENALSDLAKRFQAFYEQLMAHEESENELIARAFYEDIGVGD